MKEEDKLELFTKKVMKEAGTESPSIDFVSTVMDNISKEEKNEILTYKPIISNLNWFIMGLIGSVVAIYQVLNSSTTIESKYAYVYESYLDKINTFYGAFNPVDYSPIVVISFLVFTIFVLIQFVMIKKIFNRSIQKSFSN